MTVSVLASGQIGSDGTGTISGSHNPGVGVTPDFVAVFVIGNGSTSDGIDTITYGGVAMHGWDLATDNSGETGFCFNFSLDMNDSIPSGSQTVEVTFSNSVSRRVYCATFATDADFLQFVNSTQVSGDTANPSNTYSAGSTYASGAAAIFYGGGSAAISVANGAQLAESDFSGGSQCASLIWQNSTSTGDSTMGWTAASDDVAATFINFKEIVTLSGNVTLSGSPVENANVVVTHPSNGNLASPVLTDASGDWEVNVDKGAEAYVYCYYENGGNKYTADLHWGMSTT